MRDTLIEGEDMLNQQLGEDMTHAESTSSMCEVTQLEESE